MARSRFESPLRQQAGFLDRTEHLALISQHLETLRVDPTHFKVFEVDGLGGIGKSRLLRELRKRVVADKKAGLICWVSLEAEAFATETGPLLALRGQLNFDCLLFDTALLAYWRSIGQPFQMTNGSGLAKSLVVKTLDTGRSAAGIPVSLSFAVEIFDMIKKTTTKLSRYKKKEFEAIDALRADPTAIRERLPHYLGVDIRRRLESARKPFIAFYDAYDRQSHGAIGARSPWLRELIGTVGQGVHIVATREPMRWPPDDWGSVVHRIVLDTLPADESRQMIEERLGALPEDVVDALMVASRRVPFFLEATIDAYEFRAAQAEGAVAADELPTSPDAAITYLLDHLPREHRTLAVALAAIQMFDLGLYSHLIKTLNLPVSTVEFDEFLDWFFVEAVASDLHKTHDLLTAFVLTSEEYVTPRRAALEAATGYLRAISVADVREARRALPLFRGVIAGWRATDEIPQAMIEQLLDIGYAIYDAGYWRELIAIGRSGSAEHRALAVVTDLLSALSTRRVDGIDRALEVLERLEPQFDLLGRHRRSAEVEVAYLHELSGNYARARQDFRLLDADTQEFDPLDRTSMRSRLYNADMLLMDGEFVEASRRLLGAYESLGTRAPLEWAELVRHRAHAFRFSFALPQAEALYLQAMAAVADSPSLLGKLQTNLAETLCWSSPELALRAAALSQEINLRLGNRIELAKCGASRAIALSGLGEFVAASDAAEQAKREAEEVGYAAGVAFATQAAAVVAIRAGDTRTATEQRRTLQEILQKLGTYAHLRVAPAWMTDDQGEFFNAAADVSWLEVGDLETRLRTHLGHEDLKRD